MANLRLTDKVDFDLFYDIEILRYSAEFIVKHDITRERFYSWYGDCPSVGYELNGQPIGGMLFDDPEPHLVVLPEYHGRWAHLWKPTLEWLFSLRDPVFPRVEVSNLKCLQFMDRNNWKRIKTDDIFVTYEMTGLDHPLLTKSKIKRNGRDTQSTAL